MSDWPRYINDADENVQIVDYDPLLLRCRICEVKWSPIYREDGSLPPDAWTCPNGCTKDDLLVEEGGI